MCTQWYTIVSLLPIVHRCECGHVHGDPPCWQHTAGSDRVHKQQRGRLWERCRRHCPEMCKWVGPYCHLTFWCIGIPVLIMMPFSQLEIYEMIGQAINDSRRAGGEVSRTSTPFYCKSAALISLAVSEECAVCVLTLQPSNTSSLCMTWRNAESLKIHFWCAASFVIGHSIDFNFFLQLISLWISMDYINPKFNVVCCFFSFPSITRTSSFWEPGVW